MFAKRISRINEPQTIKMAKLSRELKATGVNVIDLSLGEPDFDTPQFIKDACIKALEEGKTKYPPVAGIPELKKAIVEKFQRENNLKYEIENIVVSAGAKHSLANVIMALIDEDDEVIIPTPYWVTYSELVHFAHGKVAHIHTDVENKFKITAKQLEEAINFKTKLFIFSSPCNPTGEVYSYEELKSLAEVFKKHPNVYIISDEIYEYINYIGKHESIAQFEDIKDRVIIINGMSKGFAMTGWRLGYMAAQKEIAKACELIQSQITSGVNMPTEWASVAALNGSREECTTMKNSFEERRNIFINLLKDIKGLKMSIPDGAFYAFPDVSYYFGKKYEDEIIENADDISMLLLQKAHVTCVTGVAFGAPNCIRFSYAASLDSLKEAATRVKLFFEKLN